MVLVNIICSRILQHIAVHEDHSQRSKLALAAATGLVHPSATAETSINTDASDTAVGAVLQQCLHGVWTPISFFSRKLLPAEKKYSTFDKELLAIYLAVKKFRYFVEGRKFAIFTDHKPLTFVFNKVSDNPLDPSRSRKKFPSSPDH